MKNVPIISNIDDKTIFASDGARGVDSRINSSDDSSDLDDATGPKNVK